MYEYNIVCVLTDTLFSKEIPMVSVFIVIERHSNSNRYYKLIKSNGVTFGDNEGQQLSMLLENFLLQATKFEGS